MALQYRRTADEDSSDESDDDYVPPEHVEVEEDGSESGEADLEPSSGGDTDLDVGKRKRKRKVRAKATSRGKKKTKYGDDLDNNDNDETTSNETLVYLPKKSSMATVSTNLNTPASGTSSGNGYSSSTPSPGTSDPNATSAATGKEYSDSADISSSSLDSAPKLAPVPHASSSTKAAPAPLSGLGSVLAKLSGKKKVSTLDKSQMDWKKYKTDNGIEEDLTQFNKGKGGFLDRKEFLERANLREFQYEQDVKSTGTRRSTL